MFPVLTDGQSSLSAESVTWLNVIEVGQQHIVVIINTNAKNLSRRMNIATDSL